MMTCPRYRSTPLIVLALALAGLPAGGCVIDRTGQSQVAAAGREMQRTQERVGHLEARLDAELSTTSQQIDTVQRDSEQNQVNLANSEALLEQMIAQSQSVQGSLERVQKRLAEIEANQQRLQDGTDFQLQEHDRRLAAMDQLLRQMEADLAGAAAASSGGGDTPEPGATSAATLERAKAAMAGGKPKSAVKLLKGFDERYPGSPEREEARFLYAKALAESGNHAEAIQTYQSIIEAYPKSSRIPEAMLSLGTSLVALGEAEEARFFLTELIRIYPNASEAKSAQERLDSLKKPN